MKNVKRGISRSIKIAVVGMFAAISVLPVPGMPTNTASAKSVRICGTKTSTQTWGNTVFGTYILGATHNAKTYLCIDTLRITEIKTAQHDCYKAPMSTLYGLRKSITGASPGGTQAFQVYECWISLGINIKGNTIGLRRTLKTTHRAYISNKTPFVQVIMDSYCC